MAAHYQRPGWFTRTSSTLIALLTRAGIGVYGSRVLEVTGRSSGQPRRTPVNLLTVDGADYLVAPRGHTQWVRNLRASGQGRLLIGSRARSLPPPRSRTQTKPPLLRAYLKMGGGRWGSSSVAWTRCE